MPLLLALLVSAAPVPTIAVLYFDYTGKDEELSVLKKGFAQILISDLSTNEAVQIVERERLEAVLAEQRLGTSGVIDAKTAAKIGKILGARYLVLGAYFEMMGSLRVDARAVEVETSKVMFSHGASGPPGEFMEVEQKLAQELNKSLASTLKMPPPEAAPPARMKTKTALRFSKALDAKDKGDKEGAKKELTVVTQEQPDFKLAQNELKKLLK